MSCGSPSCLPACQAGTEGVPSGGAVSGDEWFGSEAHVAAAMHAHHIRVMNGCTADQLLASAGRGDC